VESADLQLLLVQFHYPGMPALESDLTRAWLRKYGYQYDRFGFNVLVGSGAEIQPGIDAVTAGQFKNLTRKRIDVAAYQGSLADLIEVKPRASMGAIGQLLGYRHLWQEDYPLIAVRQLLVLAQVADQDVIRAAAAQGIQVMQMDPEPVK
jgi:hypothetical protein